MSFWCLSRVYIVDFEHLFVCWVGIHVWSTSTMKTLEQRDFIANIHYTRKNFPKVKKKIPREDLRLLKDLPEQRNFTYKGSQ